MPEWYRGSAVVVDSRTLRVTLPDGMKVTVGQPVPPEILEMMASYLRLQNANAITDAEGCGVQLGRAMGKVEGCTVQFGAAKEAEGCGLQSGKSAAETAEGCGAQLGRSAPEMAEGCGAQLGKALKA